MPSPSGLLFILTPLVLVALGMLVLRRHPRDLLRLRLGWLGLLWLAGAAAALRYTAPEWLPGWATARGGSVLLAGAWAAALAWVALNLRRRTMPMRVVLIVTAAGFTFNALAILANGGRMPFSVAAARAVGMPQAAIDGHAPLNVPLGPSHRLGWFADLIAVPGLDKVISVGDLLMIVGLAGVLLFGSGAAAPRAVEVPASPAGSPLSHMDR